MATQELLSPESSTLEAVPQALQELPVPEVTLAELHTGDAVVDIPAFEVRAHLHDSEPDMGEFADLLLQASAETAGKQDAVVEVLTDPSVDPTLVFAAAGLLVKSGRRVRIHDTNGNSLTFDVNGQIEDAIDESGTLKVVLTDGELHGDETPESHMDITQTGSVSSEVFATVGDGMRIPSRVPKIEVSGDPNAVGIAIIDEQDSALAGLVVAVPRIKNGHMVEIKNGRRGSRPLLINRPAHM